MRKHQGEPVLLATKVWVTFHGNEERKLRPGIEGKSFKGERHILDEDKPVVSLKGRKGELELSPSLTRIMRCLIQ